MATVLIVAAHPDDEILGVGGTIARHADAGDDVHILILAEGVTSRPGKADAGVALAHLRATAREAAAILGARPPILAGLPDNRLDRLDLLDLVQEVERHVEVLAPETVYTHHGSDLNLDHRLVHQAAATACRPLPGSPVRRLYAFETLSSTEWSTPATGPAFRPTRYLGIEETLDRKLAAIDRYAAEMRPFPHARSREAVAALARLRGVQAGLSAAEAFEVIREIAP
ncbi:MAG: PIG-L family deacetylase [Magnetospirillum sp. WYHS-4]